MSSIRLECPCGEVILDEDEDELVDKANEHLEAEHPHLVFTRDQILFMAIKYRPRRARRGPTRDRTASGRAGLPPIGRGAGTNRSATDGFAGRPCAGFNGRCDR
jgi:hypothetical protein